MTWKTGYAYCCAAVSVDIDRFTDSVLKRQWERAGIKGHSPEVEAYFERRCERLRAEQQLRAEQVARRRQDEASEALQVARG